MDDELERFPRQTFVMFVGRSLRPSSAQSSTASSLKGLLRRVGSAALETSYSATSSTAEVDFRRSFGNRNLFQVFHLVFRLGIYYGIVLRELARFAAFASAAFPGILRACRRNPSAPSRCAWLTWLLLCLMSLTGLVEYSAP